jgi:hypothetical protein
MVREAAMQLAHGKEEVFEKVVVFTRTRNGVAKRIRIANPQRVKKGRGKQEVDQPEA